MAMMQTIGFEKDFIEFEPEDIMLKCLESAAPIVEDEMKKAIKTSIRNADRSTGELIASIKSNKAKVDKNGHYAVFVGPKGNSKHYYYHRRHEKKSRKYALTNAAKLIWMEYGRNNQPATPVLAKTVNNSSEKAYRKMQTTFEKEAGI